MTRAPDSYAGPGTAVYGDVHEPSSLTAALAGAEVAYYLVHSLDQPDFESQDALAARAFGQAAAGVAQLIYLGGLGNDEDDLSAHLRSRREVERLLGEGGAPVTVLRAGIVVGHGGISWELTRQLVEHLPAMITPRWVDTRTQPVAVEDVVRYLVGVLGHTAAIGSTFEVGGPEVLAYRTMMKRVAALEGRRLLVLPVPLLSPGLSSRWLSLVTDVDTATARALVDSMGNEVVVRDDSIRTVVPFEPIGYDEMVRSALAERAAEPTDAQVQLVRQRAVVACTAVVGSALLGRSLRSAPGSREFYRLTAAVATTWVVGGAASGPLHLGRDQSRHRPLLAPLATGGAAFGVFYAGGLVAREVPVLRRAISSALTFADEGRTPLVYGLTLVNGAAEEVFFRGALFAAAGDRHATALSTAAYTATTAATGNPALTMAGAVMGALFGHQRRATGGIQAPLITHLTWSALMLRFLPRLFGQRT